MLEVLFVLWFSGLVLSIGGYLIRVAWLYADWVDTKKSWNSHKSSQQEARNLANWSKSWYLIPVWPAWLIYNILRIRREVLKDVGPTVEELQFEIKAQKSMIAALEKHCRIRDESGRLLHGEPIVKHSKKGYEIDIQ